MTKFQILSTPDGLGECLIMKDAMTGDGTSMVQFMKDFDGSVPTYEFSVPPEMDPFYSGEDLMVISPTQIWVIAKMVQRAYRAGFEHGLPEGLEKEKE